MFSHKIYKKLKTISHKTDKVYGHVITTDVSVYLNTRNRKKYAIKKKVIPTFDP
jgi:hypothetical protein